MKPGKLLNIKRICPFLVCFLLISCKPTDENRPIDASVLSNCSEFCFACERYERLPEEMAESYKFISNGDMVYSLEEQIFYEGKQINGEDEVEFIEDNSFAEVKTILWKYEDFPARRERLLEIDGFVLEATVDQSGCVWYTQINEEGNDQEYFLKKVDGNGKNVVDIKMREASWIGMIAANVDDSVVVQSSDCLMIYDQTGRFKGKVNLSSAALALCAGKKNIYYSIRRGSTGTEFVMIQNRKESLIKLNHDNLYGLGQAKDGNVLIWNDSKLFLFDAEAEALCEICTWTDINVYSGDIEVCWMDALGSICLVTKERTGCYFFKLTKSSEKVQNKKTVTLGVWNASDALLLKANDFNRNDTKYHISILDYADEVKDFSDKDTIRKDLERMNMELLSGNGPDMILCDEDQLKSLVQAGMIEDLAPFLDGSDVISREDFFPAALRQATYNGILAYLPETIYIDTVIGKKDVLGPEGKWTITDMLEIAKEHPDSYMFSPNPRNTRALSTVRSLYVALLLNPNVCLATEERNGGSEDLFIKVLELAKKEYESPEDFSYLELREAYRNCKVLASEISISDFGEIQAYRRDYFGKDPIDLIGYPTTSGEKGHVLRVGNGIAMLASCKEKTAAFSFMQYCATHWEEDFQYGLSANKHFFSEQVNKALTKAEKPSNNYGDIPYTQEDVLLLQDIVLSNDIAYESIADSDFFKIVDEEVQSYFSGDKTAYAVAEVISRRLKLYYSEK